MDTKFTLTSKYKYISGALILIGVAAFVYGFITNPGRSWANLLLNNYYFLSLAIGASFFIGIQYITQSGWSTMFKRVPEAMTSYIPFAAVFMLLIFFGMQALYHWSDPGAAAHDELIAHKSPYLNVPFFFIRIVLFFGLWILMSRFLRKLSLKEDLEGGLRYFEKSEYYYKVYIFILAITFSLATFDWIMSIDVHWYSTLFALKDFVAAFFHAAAIITLIILLLNDRGYFKDLNKSHLLDFSRYIFMLCIIWGYFWFAEFMLIWYANIPEETMYIAQRWEDGWIYLFYGNIFINWFIPFLFLMSRDIDRSKLGLKIISIILIFGYWIDLYIQIFPGTVGEFSIGFIEIGAFLGFGGLFALLTGIALSRAALIPKNHPYLEESLYHHA
ncbi:MAG: hypothetical protein K9I94_07225 [Bacteroidales bacterium]|nr:hypothetical protein [Bacteroidales bacterium]